jgi:hypothetical protein
MAPHLEYCPRMRFRVPLLGLVLGFALSASAQINGVPPSVTSYGFGGHTYPNAPRASVTSLGPNGYGTPALHQYQGPRFTTAPIPPNSGHHHNHFYPYYPMYYPYYPVVDPYAYGGPVETGLAVTSEDEYRGGPTIFDRRGSGELHPNDYAREQAAQPASGSTAAALPEQTAREASPEPAQPPTILIFKDGHKEEVTNYAIVGNRLFDLSPGHYQKIAIADIDIPATQKANEDEGIEFKLPTLPQGG